ncbi:MAG: hypothetical protein PHV63_01150 [Candidatus Daviesbacteria bacterium]|nr:hypothetical protein [Candidatus Daviesbacteria bacterium]
MGVRIHFLNVGSGDCTIVHFPYREVKNNQGQVIKTKEERITFIDLNHYDDQAEYENVLNYYKNSNDFRDTNGKLKPIFRFICSHPHMDHIYGLSKLFNDTELEIINFWDLEHEFVPEDLDYNEQYQNDWETYQEIRKGYTLRIIKTYREDSPRNYWKDYEDRITILSPSLKLIKMAHYNEDGSKKEQVEIDEMSYALLIRVNNKKIILGGDGQERVWNDIFENCKEEIAGCSVLKASHHGHESGFHEEAIKIMKPQFIVFSNSKQEDEQNGASDKYKMVLPNTTIYKTHEFRTIIADIPFNDTEDIAFYRS